MTERQERAALFAGVLLGGLVVLWLSRPESPALPEATTKTADSLVATQPAFDSMLDARFADLARRDARELRLAGAAARARSVADSQRSRADSLMAFVATSADSVAAGALWRQVAETRLAETVSLRTDGDSLREALANVRAARDTLFSALVLTRERLDVTMALNAQIRADVARLTECRWGGRLNLKCPTRKQAAVGGLLLGALAVVQK